MRLSILCEVKRRYSASTGMRCLTKSDLQSLSDNLPSVDKEEIDQLLYNIMYDNERLPGQSKEEYQYTGLCGVISDAIRNLLKEKGATYESGRFEINSHKGDIHSWVELDNKIIDFTASQFNPWLDIDLPDLLIIDKSDPLAKHYVKYTVKRADDFEYIVDDPELKDKLMSKYLGEL